MRRIAFGLAALALLAIPVPVAHAAEPDPAARRYPQPVRAGDLVGRRLLQPIEAQPVLGHVQGAARDTGGGLALVVRTGGTLGFGTHLVLIPLDTAALLGEHVALIGLPPAALASLPAIDPPPALLPAGEMIRMALVRPFH